MFPRKYIEILDTWMCSKMAAKLILKAAVQLTAVSIKLTAARTDTLFTYCCMTLFSSIFSSVSMSIILSVTVRFSKNFVPFCS